MVATKPIYIIFYDTLEEATIKVFGIGQLIAGSKTLKSIETNVDGISNLLALSFTAKNTISELGNSSSSSSIVETFKSALLHFNSNTQIISAADSIKKAQSIFVASNETSTVAFIRKDAFAKSDGSSDIEAITEAVKIALADMRSVMNISSYSGAIKASDVDVIANADIAAESIAAKKAVLMNAGSAALIPNPAAAKQSSMQSDIESSLTSFAVSNKTSLIEINAEIDLNNETIASKNAKTVLTGMGNLNVDALSEKISFAIVSGNGEVQSFSFSTKSVESISSIGTFLSGSAEIFKTLSSLIDNLSGMESVSNATKNAFGIAVGQGVIESIAESIKKADLDLQGLSNASLQSAANKFSEATSITNSTVSAGSSMTKAVASRFNGESLNNFIANIVKEALLIAAGQSIISASTEVIKAIAANAGQNSEITTEMFASRSALATANAGVEIQTQGEKILAATADIEGQGNVSGKISINKSAEILFTANGNIDGAVAVAKILEAFVSVSSILDSENSVERIAQMEVDAISLLENSVAGLRRIAADVAGMGNVESKNFVLKSIAGNAAGHADHEGKPYGEKNVESNISSGIADFNATAEIIKNLMAGLRGENSINSNASTEKKSQASNAGQSAVDGISVASKLSQLLFTTHAEILNSYMTILYPEASASSSTALQNYANAIKVISNEFSGNGRIDATSNAIRSLQSSIGFDANLISTSDALKNVNNLLENFSSLKNEISSLKTIDSSLEATSEIAAQNYKEVAALNLMLSIASIAAITSNLLQAKAAADNRTELNGKISADKNSSNSCDAGSGLNSTAMRSKNVNSEVNASSNVLTVAEIILNVQNFVSTLTQLGCLAETIKEAGLRSVGQSSINGEGSKEATASAQEKASSSLKGTAYDTKTLIEILAFSPTESGITVLFKNDAATDPVSANGDPVGAILDHRNGLKAAYQGTAGDKPIWDSGKKGFRFPTSGNFGRISINLPQAFTGKLIESISKGTVVLGVSIPSGVWQGYTGATGYQSAARKIEATSALLFCRDTSADFIQSKLDELQTKGATIGFVYPGGATSLAGFWQFRQEITDFPWINTAGVTNLGNTWDNCTNIGLGSSDWQFPAIDTSSVTSLFTTWRNCSQIKRFPYIDTRKCTSFSSTWINCAGLGEGDPTWEFPSIDTNATLAANQSTAVILQNTWQSCAQIKRFPLINTSKVTSFASTWRGCTSLGLGDPDWAFPSIDTSKATSLAGAWQGCSNLGRFPLIDTSKVDTVGSGGGFGSTWLSCNSLGLNDPNWTFPAIDTSKGINFVNTWRSCSEIKAFAFPANSFSSVETGSAGNAASGFAATWFSCTKLKTFPANVFNDCKCINYFQAFQNCALDATSVNNILISIAAAAQTYSLNGGQLDMQGGTNAAPSGAGLMAKNYLTSSPRLWTVNTN